MIDYLKQFFSLEAGRIPDAISAFEQAVASNPCYADGYFRLGITLEKQGDSNGAIVAYDRATELDPSLTEAWLAAALGGRSALYKAAWLLWTGARSETPLPNERHLFLPSADSRGFESMSRIAASFRLASVIPT